MRSAIEDAASNKMNVQTCWTNVFLPWKVDAASLNYRGRRAVSGTAVARVARAGHRPPLASSLNPNLYATISTLISLHVGCLCSQVRFGVQDLANVGLSSSSAPARHITG
nr:hypothetical protein CFP56_76244 [Quercus suber]